jgi:ubiquitin C-terminal hydrolase
MINIEGSMSFVSALKKNFKYIHHYGDNQPGCTECDAKICHTLHRVTFASPVLLFNIVRQGVSQETDAPNHSDRSRFKITDSIQFPLELNLNDVLSCTEGRSWPMYSLRALIYHIGGDSLDWGHYVAVVRSGNKWFHCDNASVHEINEVFLFLES